MSISSSSYRLYSEFQYPLMTQGSRNSRVNVFKVIEVPNLVLDLVEVTLEDVRLRTSRHEINADERGHEMTGARQDREDGSLQVLNISATEQIFEAVIPQVTLLLPVLDPFNERTNPLCC